jgi:hypothetical protein
MDWYYVRDEQTHGPFEAGQLGNLLARGHIEAQTPVWQEGLPDWITLGESELLSGFNEEESPPSPAASPALSTPVMAESTPVSPDSIRITPLARNDLGDELAHLSRPAAGDRELLANAARSGAHWFYWIAALSVINLILNAVHSPISLALGLGITDLIYYLSQDTSEDALLKISPHLALGLDIGLIAMTCLLGWVSSLGYRYIFLLGILLIALDGLLFIFPFFSVVGLGVHAYAVYSMGLGLLALWKLKSLPLPDLSPESVSP